MRMNVVALLLAAVVTAHAEGTDVQWTRGPATVSLGSHVAQLPLTEGYAFTDGAGTRKIMEAMGNPASDREVGLLYAQAEGKDWFLVFEYHPVGYVPDDEKDRIDADADVILASIREGTEEANQTRKKLGIPGLQVVGWSEKPHYDPETHNLEWAILAKSDDGGEVVNHNIRLLGRQGYMSITLVDDAEDLAASRTEARAVLAGFAYTPGKRYAEYVSGDRLAEFGLSALVVGGAGAAAVKLGFFASLWKLLAKGYKLVVVAVIAFVALLRRILGALFRREERVTMPNAG
jgi:uncharacterized membrane-anchored protein